MARTNYQHGKRLREIAKKQKREEKAQKRKERKEAAAAGLLPEGESVDLPDDDDEDEAADADAPVAEEAV
ncbi:MAG: hypothetical protein NDJ75_04930 [Thermoanaerobaculia bacterium]|nr:hypothetical protein [Thermoanaerobaculia bacterium]